MSLLRRVGTAIAAATFAAGLSAAGWAGYLNATGNFHAAIPGRLYRSAELSREGFEQAIMRFHIRTVINLRGAAAGWPWYRNELLAARVTGARHIDLRLSATHQPDPATLDEIRRVLASAQPPILIHCQGGADRSGLVAALYELWIAKRPPAQAGAQLSFRYGHFPWLGSRTAAMDDAWRSVLRAASVNQAYAPRSGPSAPRCGGRPGPPLCGATTAPPAPPVTFQSHRA